MGSVAHLWRHPIKSHGREALDAVDLSAGACVPWDRHWAVTHEASKFNGEAWATCHNFMIGTRNPALAGLWAKLDETTGEIELRHGTLGSLRFAPDSADGGAKFLDWIAPICPPERAQPTGVVSLAGRGMTDTDYPSVSIMNLSSHRAVAQKLGHELEHERWRGNIWLDGLGPWEEFEWIGKTLRVGEAEIEIRDRIERCMHTAANPITGKRDAKTLDALENGWGHRDFGIYGVVTKGGTVRLGDMTEVL